MKRVVIACALLSILSACKGSPETPSVEASPRPTLTRDREHQMAACTQAVAASGDDDPAPVPLPCAGLSDADYLDAYYEGLRQHNEEGRERLLSPN